MKYVYDFSEGDGKNKQLLGGKGAGLCDMFQAGINVPPGFVITTEACLAFLDEGSYSDALRAEVGAHISALEQTTGKGFGSADNPLLISVRSGSALSMPGMMDTILNLGLNEDTVQGLIAQSRSARFAYDTYRRFIQLFGKIALGVPEELFDASMKQLKQELNVEGDLELRANHLRELCTRFLTIVDETTGFPFPVEPHEQLDIAIQAVFRSWNGKRARDYRKKNHITPDMAHGTAVNIVAMVFGNLGDDCATGVGFTRNPSSGENVLFGEYLMNAQGEDIVAGSRTPNPIATMRDEWPEMYEEIHALARRLEAHTCDVQDYEWTVEKGVLYCLQTRNGKLTAAAAVRTSVEFEGEGVISRERALLRINPKLLEQLLHPQLDPNHTHTAVAKGLAASPGAGSGKAVFSADRAEQQGNLGEAVILVREETKPEDIHGFFGSVGILTSRGGKTSHAAVVAREHGKPCVAGADGIVVDDVAAEARIGGVVVREGDIITIDGSTGEVFLGEVPMMRTEFSSDAQTLLAWADDAATMRVYANADTPEDAKRARSYGAVGIGLCRTERMFNASERLPVVQKMILAHTEEERRAALEELLPMQRADFVGIFKVMAPYPVTIRLLDPPLHEFLPSVESVQRTIATLSREGADVGEVEIHQRMLSRIRELNEVNPMLGHRGVRLAITHPEIPEMQLRAILEAAAQCIKDGIPTTPEIMVPQVVTVQELHFVRGILDRVQDEVKESTGVYVRYGFGSMIETVRACTRTSGMTEHCQFYSFGTNDLTQATFSFSREDAENKFLPLYNETGILQHNPFEVLDVHGVGVLMKLALQQAREVNPDVKAGICGEQAADPQSTRFCHMLGLNYVSCSPPRVPIARLAAAQAALRCA